MGLFTRFKKARPIDIVDEDEVLARLSANSELQRQRAHTDQQRDIARATVLKIDAIEAAMAADIFNEPEPAFRRPPRPALPTPPPESSGQTLPLAADPVTELMDEDELPAEAAAAENAPVVEEVALLYASGDVDAAGELLRAAVADPALPPGTRDRTVWWMLFDLYQVLGRQEAFDDLSIDYASTFETSPPPWNPPPAGPAGDRGGVTPTVQFTGLLDASAALPVVQLRNATAAALRIDFSRVHAVAPEGCALLLDALLAVPAGRELILSGADELLEQIRAIIDVGRRDEGEAPWLLLLELLRLLNREKEFEESSMDYCVTFELSPPSFVAPGNVVSTPRQASAPAADRFMLPHSIEGDIAPLLEAVRAHADEAGVLVLDCSHLARSDMAAAGQLLAALRALPPLEEGKRRQIELRELNHLVAALLRLLGAGDAARLLPHRY